jgi:hypothetical protein
MLNEAAKASLVRRYAKSAHKEYIARLDTMREILADRPMNLDGDHFTNFYTARALYALYSEALALNAVGGSDYSDDKVLDRIRDARTSQLRWLLTNKLVNGGMYGLTQQILENAARKFISDMTVIEE